MRPPVALMTARTPRSRYLCLFALCCMCMHGCTWLVGVRRGAKASTSLMRACVAKQRSSTFFVSRSRRVMSHALSPGRRLLPSPPLPPKRHFAGAPTCFVLVIDTYRGKKEKRSDPHGQESFWCRSACALFSFCALLHAWAHMGAHVSVGSTFSPHHSLITRR